MTKLDDWLSAAGDEADFDQGQLARLEAAIAREPSPRAARRERLVVGTAAAVAVAVASGALVGGLVEVGRGAPPEALLPASQTGTVSALLFGEG